MYVYNLHKYVCIFVCLYVQRWVVLKARDNLIKIVKYLADFA